MLCILGAASLSLSGPLFALFRSLFGYFSGPSEGPLGLHFLMGFFVGPFGSLHFGEVPLSSLLG